MQLSAADRQRIQQFRQRLTDHYAGDPRVLAVSSEDRPDDSTLSTRLQVSEHIWLDLTIRPFLPHLRGGIMTDDRWANEELEEAIEETGDEMGEFIEASFDAVGLEWKNPLVEHYRDQGKYFYFATAHDLGSLARIDAPETFERARLMIEGYYDAFASRIRRLNAPAK